MNTIKLNTPHYNIILMFNLNQISFTCKEVAQELDMKENSNRTYDLPTVNISDVDFGMEQMSYIYIFFEDETHWQIKLESPNTIVLDHFTNAGELIKYNINQ